MYLRITGNGGEACVAIVMTKTKVVPIKRLTIPHLESCRPLVLARLMDKAAKTLCVQTENIYAWTNSLVVLSWL